MNIIMIFNFSLFIREDSIMFSLTKGHDASAKRLIQKIYSKDEDTQLILDSLKS